MSYQPKYIRRKVAKRKPLIHGWSLLLSCGHRVRHPARVAGATVRRPVCWECHDEERTHVAATILQKADVRRGNTTLQKADVRSL